MIDTTENPQQYVTIPRHVGRADPDRYHLEDYVRTEAGWCRVRRVGTYGNYGEAMVRKTTREDKWPERYLGPDRTHELRINDTHKRGQR